MGGGFGNKNQCHDFDLMAAVLAKQTGAPVRLELTRKEDYVAVHGRWPTRQYYKVGVSRDGRLQAIQLRGYSGMGPYRKGSGSIAGTELYECPHVETMVHPVYTNTAVAANYRAPAYPQGVFGIESLMDHIAHELKIDPLEFRLRNATRKYHGELPYTSYGLEDCMRRGAEAFEWKRRWRQPARDAGLLKRGVGMAMGAFGARVGRSSAVIRLDARGRYHGARGRHRRRARRQNHDGDDCGRGARRAARAHHGRQRRHGPLSVLRRRVRQPDDEFHRLRRHRSRAGSAAAGRGERPADRRPPC